MDNENIKWLTTVPATDINFRSHLHIATDEEIEWSITLIKRKRERGNATRIRALQRELRKRARKRRNGNEQ